MSAVLVESGSFRVDRKKALDKLMQFQLPEPSMYLLAWVQAAAAAGATRIEFAIADGGLEMSFDGKLWTSAELKDPYSAFFNRGAGVRGDRDRALAVGLLSALRTGPDHITIRSGAHAVTIKSVTEESFGPAGRPGANSIRVARRGAFGAELDHVRRRCLWAPAKVIVAGETLAPPAPEGPFLDFKGGGRSGRVWMTAEPAKESVIQLVVYGVTVAEHKAELSAAQVKAVLRDDGLKLNLSQTSVVKGPRLSADIGLIGRQAHALLGRSIEEARKLAGEAGAELAKGEGHDDWLYWENFLHGILPSSADSTTVRRLSIILGALRQACVAKRETLRRGRKGLADKLWAAPVAFDEKGAPLTLREIDAFRRGFGHVPYSAGPEPHPVVNGRAVWVLRTADLRFLEAMFPGEVRSVRRGWGEDTVDLVGVLGDRLLLEEALQVSELEARVGFALSARESGTRLRWLVPGRAPLHTEVDTGRLRLEGAISVTQEPDPELIEKCRAALVAWAPTLYHGLARSYRPAEENAAQAAIREHLLDFLAEDFDAKTGKLRKHPQLASLRLFRDVQGRMLSLIELSQLAAQELRPVLVSPPHPPKLAFVAKGRPDRVRQLLGNSPWVRGIRTIKPAGKGEEAEVALPPAGAARTPEERVEHLRKALRELAPLSGGTFTDRLIADLRAQPHDGYAFRKSRSGWEIGLQHPLVQRLLDQPDEETAEALLISLLFSAINRESSRLSDAHDVEFQTALARRLLER